MWRTLWFALLVEKLFGQDNAEILKCCKILISPPLFIFSRAFCLAKPHDIGVGIDTGSDSSTAPPSPSSSRGDVKPDPIPQPSGPTSSRTSWASHPWDDDEYWDDYQNYLNHDSFFIEEDSFFIEEEGEEVCLFPSVWREWTRGPEEVCLFPSVWSEWSRTRSRQHGKVRGSRGRRTTTKKNKKRRVPRRRRDRRRRAALRRKRLARRARVGGSRRRPRTCFLRGGANPEQDEQVCFSCVQPVNNKACSGLDKIT